MNAWSSRASLGRWARIFGAWTIVSLLVATQTRLRAETEASWPALFAFQLAYWGGWALLTPPITALARRHPFRRESLWRSLGLHGVAGVLVALLMTAYFAFLIGRVVPEGHRDYGQPFLALFWSYVGRGFHYDLLTYAAVVSIGLVSDLRRQVHERSLRASKLETELVEAQLHALRVQLQPHFLFNTLHSIASLVEEDPPGARRLIAQLSDLLRQTLERGERMEVDLREELELVDRYLEIQVARFGDRIRIERRVGRDCLEAKVPSLVLQPLVENALRHGILRQTEGGRIAIEAGRSGDDLELRVRDDGPGLEGTGEPQDGVGLSNVRARLEHLYGSKASLALASSQGGGLCVSLRLPFHLQEAHP